MRSYHPGAGSWAAYGRVLLWGGLRGHILLSPHLQHPLLHRQIPRDSKAETGIFARPIGAPSVLPVPESDAGLEEQPEIDLGFRQLVRVYSQIDIDFFHFWSRTGSSSGRVMESSPRTRLAFHRRRVPV